VISLQVFAELTSSDERTLRPGDEAASEPARLLFSRNAGQSTALF